MTGSQNAEARGGHGLSHVHASRNGNLLSTKPTTVNGAVGLIDTFIEVECALGDANELTESLLRNLRGVLEFFVDGSRSAEPPTSSGSDAAIALMVVTRWTADPQKPIACGYGGADRRREEHWHPLGLAPIPGIDQTIGILKNLGIGRAPAGRFLLHGCPALIFHLAAIEAHSRIVVEWAYESTCSFIDGNRGMVINVKATTVPTTVECIADSDSVAFSLNYLTR